MNIENKTQTVEIKFENKIKSKDLAKNWTKMYLRVAGYARVSTMMEEQQSSYISQKKHYNNLIKQNPNWELVKVYADEGISGTQLKNRDQFNEMIKDAVEGKIDLIIAKSISRFARNTVDTLNCIRLLREHNVDVFFEKENIHTLSLSNELFLTFYSAFAQAESESLSENLKGGLYFKMKRGEMVGCYAPYGYEYDKKTQNLVIKEPEASVVRRIFKEYASGKGIISIKNDLNNDGILSSTGKKWKPETIRRMIRNEKYKGDLVTGKTFVADVITHKKKINNGESYQFYTENHHEAIVSNELWEQAHSILKTRSDKVKGIRDKYSRRYAFSSKIYCGCCGQRFVRSSYIKNKRNPNSERVIYWRCRSHINDIECENQINYYDQELKKLFVIVYNQFAKEYNKYLPVFLNKMNSILNNDKIVNEESKLNKDHENILEKQKKLIDLHLNNSISKEILNAKMVQLNEELKENEEKLLKIKEKDKIKKSKLEQLENINKILTENKHLEEFDDDIFESIVDKIIIGNKNEKGEFIGDEVKFILKTGEVISNDKIFKSYENVENKLSTLNVSLEKQNSNDNLTVYIQHKRFWVCSRRKWEKRLFKKGFIEL